MFEVKVTKIDLSDRRKQKVLFKRVLNNYEMAMDLIDDLEDRYDSRCHSIEFNDLSVFNKRRDLAFEYD